MVYSRGMSDSDIALAAIDLQIEAREKRIAKMRPILETLEQERDALIQSRAIVATAPSKNGHQKIASLPTSTPTNQEVLTAAIQTDQPSMLDVAEEILGDKELHVNEITKKLHGRGYTTSKAVVTTALARRAAKGIRFRRVEGKPNTFARLKQSGDK
jgi:hypothetical protein